jgi:prepilin-type processing-associated H-X9-DG protein
MGMGTTNILGRLLASLYKEGPVGPEFQHRLDVPNGGVLLALPCLLAMGLLRYTKRYFSLPQGYYSLESIFLLLAFMALARMKNMESLRYCSPGEWGKLLGLDRIPEVRTLREKVKLLTSEGEAYLWGGRLSSYWMDLYPDLAGVLYVDGHVRIYNGHQTELPRHHVSRQRLCLRATTDYWVNAMDGQPFFMINKPVDPGLVKVVEHEIVPRLEAYFPRQQELFTSKEVQAPRFTLVFDREGYSPGFMARMWKKRIACLTYHKYPGTQWPVSEFQEYKVTLASGNTVSMPLAERGVHLGDRLWVREIRKLRKSSGQTAIISTDPSRDLRSVAATMFARWSQENFFKYMREQYNLDGLVDYSTQKIPDTIEVINPAYREVDSEIKKLAARLGRRRCECNGIVLCDDIDADKVEDYEMKKQALQEEIHDLEQQITDLKACRRQTPRHVQFSDLPPEDKFRKLGMKSKYFIDTIKMIAYRAETAMVNIVRETMSRGNEARRLLRSLYVTDADLVPDYEKKKLIIRLHQPANHANGMTIRHLCQELNTSRTKFPGTELRLVYEMVS